ncbi:hypothetical protein HanRHA438_Chr06g0284421 [Helianthus annuus]|nr:hypothetical protein HanRHA438_Chr06g0284421 [Helianthus annuus]
MKLRRFCGKRLTWAFGTVMRPYARPCISDKQESPGDEPGVQLTVQGNEGKPENARSFLMENGRANPRSNNISEWNDHKSRRASQMPERNGRAKPRTTVRDRRPVNDL